MSNGKPVSSLKAGRYRFAITDEDPRARSILWINVGLTKDLTGVSFVGKHSVTLNLTGGRWSYFSGAESHAFAVTPPADRPAGLGQTSRRRELQREGGLRAVHDVRIDEEHRDRAPWKSPRSNAASSGSTSS